MFYAEVKLEDSNYTKKVKGQHYLPRSSENFEGNILENVQTRNIFLQTLYTTRLKLSHQTNADNNTGDSMECLAPDRFLHTGTERSTFDDRCNNRDNKM